MSMSAASEQIMFNEMMRVRKHGKYSPHESNYTRLFGTPERAARTAYDLHECSLGMPIECDDCAAKPICESGTKDYDALLAWLKGESQ